MTLWKWSTDPATNGSADSTCPWPEGMAPSQVNDSARGNMAAIAKYRDDISGKLVTSGTSSAYTVTSNQGFDTLAHLDGAMIAFVPHVTSGAAPTLNVDGLGAKPLRGQSGSDLLPAVLLEDTPYVAFYNNSNGEFVLHSYFVNPGEVPIGAGIDYWGTTAPSDNWVFPYGQAISRTSYATCFARLGTTFGSGDGTTTFNLPDKRSRVSAGRDDMGGSAASRLTSTYFGTDATVLGAAGGNQSVQLVAANLPPYTPSGTVTGVSVTSNFDIQINQGGVDHGAPTAGPNDYARYSPGRVTSTGTGSFNGSAQGGTSTPVRTVQPTIVCNYVIRIK